MKRFLTFLFALVVSLGMIFTVQREKFQHAAKKESLSTSLLPSAQSVFRLPASSSRRRVDAAAFGQDDGRRPGPPGRPFNRRGVVARDDAQQHQQRSHRRHPHAPAAEREGARLHAPARLRRQRQRQRLFPDLRLGPGHRLRH